MPSFFFDHDLPTVYGGLLDGRADAIGPDDADLPRADAVIAGARRPWNAAAFAAAGPRLRVVSRVGIGYDNVDLGAASAAGVVVCNTPDGPTVSTAEHTWALLLAVARELPSQQQRARDGLAGPPIGTALELDGRVLGLAGDLSFRLTGGETALTTSSVAWSRCQDYRFSSARAEHELGYAPGPIEPAIIDALAYFVERGWLPDTAADVG